ncbi:hypothetical protein [Xenorhabdus sp. KJ12.1]|uniref:hypothetical protein n=1 Tax=Xenorhabdus sp. KJ12.1 TaxID=1851571 RepID=UPI000C03D02E|nr:hypothetical protein [Xenorhabdus sp. KJ12.1]PHM72335.1 hypothetical protein Xekj_00613 [Xenorhabdus sp. KJ12.1]
MNTAIYAATNNGIQSHIIIGEKAYYFFTLHDSEAASDYGGYVFPPLCTYIFTDKNRQPIATIIIHSCKEPEMMDVDWNGKSKTPIIKPMFTRESLLGVPPAISMRELTLSY